MVEVAAEAAGEDAAAVVEVTERPGRNRDAQFGLLVLFLNVVQDLLGKI